MIVLVDPISSGDELARAFREAGERCLHLYTPQCVEAYHSDRSSEFKMLHRDIRETIERFEKLQVSRVVPASEFGVLVAEEISAAIGLPGNEKNSGKARRDKHAMMEKLRQAGIPSATSVSVGSTESVDEAVDSFGGNPFIVKPRNSAGSEGCTHCRTLEEGREAVSRILNHRNLMGETNDEVVLQEYLDGPQYIVNTVTMEGSHLLADFYRTRIDQQENSSPLFRNIRSPLGLDSVDQKIVEYTVSCLDALGIREGASHSEVRWTEKGPRLVEINARVMGPCLAPDAYFSALGYSHQHLLVERYLSPENFSKRFESSYEPRRSLAKVFLRAHAPGVINSVPGLNVLRRLPGFHSVARLPEIGRQVPDRLLTTGASGIAFLAHEDEHLLAASLDTLHEMEDSGEFYEITQ